MKRCGEAKSDTSIQTEQDGVALENVKNVSVVCSSRTTAQKYTRDLTKAKKRKDGKHVRMFPLRS